MYPGKTYREEWIRRKAFELYQERMSEIAPLVSQTPLDDWLYAESALRVWESGSDPISFESHQEKDDWLQWVAFRTYQDRQSRIAYLQEDDWLRAERMFSAEYDLTINLQPEAEMWSTDNDTSGLTTRLGELANELAAGTERAEPGEYGFNLTYTRKIPPIYGPTTMEIIHPLATALSVACAAGGIKWLVEIFKIWVEDRKGRKIMIKKGEVQIELQGGLSDAEIERAVKLIKEHFEEPKILVP